MLASVAASAAAARGLGYHGLAELLAKLAREAKRILAQNGQDIAA
jgi:hypothetical protein